MTVAMRHLTEPAQEIRRLQPDLSDSLQLVLDRALAKEGDERYPRASDPAFDLRALVEPSSFRAPLSHHQQVRL